MSTSRRSSSTSCYDPPPVAPTMGIAQPSKEAAWPFDSLIKVDDSWTLKITVGFLKDSTDYREEKRTAVLNSIKTKNLQAGRETWEQFANVSFEETDDVDNANIRVAFTERGASGGSWSYIGQNANKHKGVTLNLGTVDIFLQPKDDDFGTILHEFGHALGLLHEHQNPLRGATVTRKIRNNTAYTRIYGQELVDDQMVSVVKEGSITNISAFDRDSIMMYQIDGVTDMPNNKLSKLDKAFIMLNYPPDLTDYKDEKTKKRLSRFNTAMLDAGVQTKAGEILQAFIHPGPVLKKSIGNPPPISDSLEAVRILFTEYNRTMFLRRPNVNISNSVNPSSMQQYNLSLRREPGFGLTDPVMARRFGLTDPIGDVAKNKLFRSLVKHMVKDTLVQRGIPLREPIPGTSPTVVATMMAAVGAHEGIASYIKAYMDELQGPAEEGHDEDEKEGAKEQK